MSIATKAGCEEPQQVYTEICLWTTAQETQKQRVEQRWVLLWPVQHKHLS